MHDPHVSPSSKRVSLKIRSTIDVQMDTPNSTVRDTHTHTHSCTHAHTHEAEAVFDGDKRRPREMTM